MSNLILDLNQIEHSLERLRRLTLLGKLSSGLPPSQIREILGGLGLPNNSQLETLFGWRNGTDTRAVSSLDDIHMFPGFYMLSIEDASANYRSFRGDPRWTPGWLPIFANGGGDFYVIDVAGQKAGEMRHFRIDEDDHPVEFESVEAMAATLAAAFDRDIFFVDSNGYLEMNDMAFAAVAAELNPLIAYWTD